MKTTDLDQAIEESIVASYLLLAEHANDPELADAYRRRAATMQGTTDEWPSKAIIAQVQKNLEEMFTKGVVVDIAGDDLSAAYLEKAATTNDPALAAGYRKLAKKAQKVGRWSGTAP